jgi:hypothetical protein
MTENNFADYIIWSIGAYNTEGIYAYGTESEVDRYVNWLNRDREINLYSAESAENPNEIDEYNIINLADELAELSQD